MVTELLKELLQVVSGMKHTIQDDDAPIASAVFVRSKHPNQTLVWVIGKSLLSVVVLGKSS